MKARIVPTVCGNCPLRLSQPQSLSRPGPAFPVPHPCGKLWRIRNYPSLDELLVSSDSTRLDGTGSRQGIANLKFDGRLKFSIRLSPALRLTLLGLSILAFIAALPLTALTQANSEEPIVSSRQLFMVGWMGVMFGYVEWLANPLLLWSWIASYFNRPRASGLAALCAFGLTLMFLRRHYLHSGHQSGGTTAILSLGPGYWLWLVSAFIMLVANVDELINSLKGKPPARQ
jgi:hypothetical protein